MAFRQSVIKVKVAFTGFYVFSGITNFKGLYAVTTRAKKRHLYEFFFSTAFFHLLIRDFV